MQSPQRLATQQVHIKLELVIPTPCIVGMLVAQNRADGRGCGTQPRKKIIRIVR